MPKEHKNMADSNGFCAVYIKPEAAVLLHECKKLSPPDQYGRRLPLYAVIHVALEQYKESLGGARRSK